MHPTDQLPWFGCYGSDFVFFYVIVPARGKSGGIYGDRQAYVDSVTDGAAPILNQPKTRFSFARGTWSQGFQSTLEGIKNVSQCFEITTIPRIGKKPLDWDDSLPQINAHLSSIHQIPLDHW